MYSFKLVLHFDTIGNFLKGIFWRCSMAFGQDHKYQTQLCISGKLKKKNCE